MPEELGLDYRGVWGKGLHGFGSDGVTEANVNLDRKTRGFEVSDEGHSNSFVVLILFDPINPYGCRIEAQTIVVYGHSAYFFKDFLEPFQAVVALR